VATVLANFLCADPYFEVVGAPQRHVAPFGLLEELPEQVRERAYAYVMALEAGGGANVAGREQADPALVFLMLRLTEDLALPVTTVADDEDPTADSCSINGTAITPAAIDGNITMDGTPDLVTVGGPGMSQPFGAWLTPGRPDGGVIEAATDIGVNGLQTDDEAGTAKPSGWDGAQASPPYPGGGPLCPADLNSDPSLALS